MCKYLFTVGLALTVLSVQAQTTQPQAQQSTTQPAQDQMNRAATYNSQHPMLNSQAQASNDIDHMLIDTERARHEIQNNNTTAAEQDVNRAIQQVDQLSASSNATADNGLVPLFTEIGDTSVITIRSQNGPNAAAQNEAGQNTWNNSQPANLPPNNSSPQTLNNQMRNGQTSNSQVSANTLNQNENQNQNQSSQNQADFSVRRVQGQFTSISLDVNMAKSHLQAAQQALQQGNTAAADSALAAVQDSFVSENVSADLPLLRARENLMIARAAVNQGDTAEAQTALHSAARALANYDQTGGSHAAQAQQLQSQIANCNVQDSNANNQIESWWTEVAGWTTPATRQ